MFRRRCRMVLNSLILNRCGMTFATAVVSAFGIILLIPSEGLYVFHIQISEAEACGDDGDKRSGGAHARSNAGSEALNIRRVELTALAAARVARNSPSVGVDLMPKQGAEGRIHK